ncbi:MAG: hypothetical protein NTU98_02160 [Bacteroidetes bacterium]|nr:hypothetical protein [Bacteroidota bacterium]
MSGFSTNILEHIKKANHGITHEEFIKGLQNNTLDFRMAFQEPRVLLSSKRKIYFSIYCMIYQIVPLLLLPLLSLLEKNWWLLLGIGFSYFGSLFSAKFVSQSKKQNSIGGLLLLIFVIFWITLGFSNYFTIFTLCFLFGFIFFHIADEIEKYYAVKSLQEDKNLFNKAIEQNIIIIEREPGLTQEERMQRDLEKMKNIENN